MACDLSYILSVLPILVFQSTHAHGVRLYIIINSRYFKISFNPRTHMACDLEFPKEVFLIVCFNPRTHMACDVSSLINADRVDKVSIHARTWRATQIK